MDLADVEQESELCDALCKYYNYTYFNTQVCRMLQNLKMMLSGFVPWLCVLVIHIIVVNSEISAAWKETDY